MKKGLVIGIIVVVVIALIWIFYPRTIKVDCVAEGEIAFNLNTGEDYGDCCAGLSKIITPEGYIYENGLCQAIEGGGLATCSSSFCGDGTCDGWESKCGCPEDCKIEDECITDSDCPLVLDEARTECREGICHLIF